MKKNGFTLIELMVSFGVIMLLAAGGIVSMSNFAAKDRMLAAKNEVVSGMKLARNYAMSMQKPSGFNDQLDSVAVTLTSSGVMTAYPVTLGIGVGTSYFSKKVGPNSVVVTPPITLGMLVYSIPEGKLLGYVGDVVSNETFPRDSNYVLNIGISAIDTDVGETRTVVIRSSGTFDEN